MSGKQQNLEEIVMVVESVKNKKIEGTLYLMSERIAWMPKQKNVFTISHHYVDIKSILTLFFCLATNSIS